MLIMGRFGGCTSPIELLVLALLTREVTANHDARYKIHRLDKEYDALRRRDGTCNSGYTACAASLGGDCCPNNYACASTYCYATTAGPSTACGKVGFHNCGDEAPGKCCQDGTVCGRDGLCTPAAGEGNPISCSANYYLCPSSVNYGCCPNGLGCGQGACYSTSPSTAVVSKPTVTTDSKGNTVTSQVLFTTTITPDAASITAGNGAVPKLVASTLSKLPAIPTVQGSSSSSGGLSSAALGGIVAGVIILLIVVVVAAFIIVRRLRRTEKAVEVSKRGTSNGQQTTSSHKLGSDGPIVTEVSIDPLSRATPSLRPSHYRGGSDSSVNGHYSSPGRSPPLSDGRATPPAWPGYYNPVPNGEGDGPRHPSVESIGGQFDYNRYPQHSQGHHIRGSYESQTTYTYRPGRWSNASEVSGNSADGAHGTYAYELDGNDTSGRRRSSGTTRPTGATRRQSGDSAYYRGRSESAAAGTVAPHLEAVNETAELHGHHGPQDKQVGQTAARPTSTGSP